MRAKFSASAPEHGALHRPRRSPVTVRPLLRHSLQCHLPGRGERLDGRPAAELHRETESDAERRWYNHSHLHHGSLLRYLRGGTSGQHPRHVRGGQVNTGAVSYYKSNFTVFVTGFKRSTEAWKGSIRTHAHTTWSLCADDCVTFSDDLTLCCTKI